MNRVQFLLESLADLDARWGWGLGVGYNLREGCTHLQSSRCDRRAVEAVWLLAGERAREQERTRVQKAGPARQQCPLAPSCCAQLPRPRLSPAGAAWQAAGGAAPRVQGALH